MSIHSITISQGLGLSVEIKVRNDSRESAGNTWSWSVKTPLG